jgi:Fic family protein
MLVNENSAFKNSLPPVIVPQLASLIRSMNCYYSNLIEGHNTHPVDIEKAMRGDYSHDVHKRDLQYEAIAHISTQKWIEENIIPHGKIFSQQTIRDIHERFYQSMPDSFKIITDPKTGAEYQITAGALREKHVQVGLHIAIHPEDVPIFLNRLEQAYAQCGKMQSLMIIPCMHHRLLWVHPFIDGNGRVARLLTQAMLDKDLDTGSLWSVSRGLARQSDRYKTHLAACDMERRHDFDGRGHLSHENLVEFVTFFFEICLDQIRFMRHLMQPQTLHHRIMLWVEEAIRLNQLPKQSDLLMQAILHRGEITRMQSVDILGVGERQARRITAELLELGVITSPSPKSSLQLAFPASLAHRWMPGLFPEKIEQDKF